MRMYVVYATVYTAKWFSKVKIIQLNHFQQLATDLHMTL